MCIDEDKKKIENNSKKNEIFAKKKRNKNPRLKIKSFS